MNPRLERYFRYAEEQVICTNCLMTEKARADELDPLQPGEKVAIDNHAPEVFWPEYEASLNRG